MNTEMLYELYEITEKNDSPDLATVGMAMLREMREFTGRHGQKLAAAYPDKEAFAAAVAAGVAEDEAAKEEAERE